MILGIGFHQSIVSINRFCLCICFLGSVEKCHLSVLGFIFSLLMAAAAAPSAVVELAPLCRVENLGW